MKKLHERKGINLPFLKFDLKMKLTALLVFTSFFNILASTGYSQVITLDAQNTTVEKIIDKIEVTSKYAFVYNRKFVDLQRKVSIKVKDVLIETVLSKLFDGTKTSYEVIDTEIFLKERIVLKERVDKSSSSIMPQELEIKGTVTDDTGQPLPSANILEKNTTNGTQTDFDGNYKIDVKDSNSVLVISFIGFTTQEIQVNKQQTINVQLLPDAASLDEVVVVGYGTQSKAKVTNAVSSIKAEAIVDAPITSFEEGIAGQLAGVQIVQTSGDPGSRADINIRGVGTLTAGASPLIVVDGFPSENLNLKTINPSAIESIDVLKDAASAAIYGSRGSNGVIIVTTKKGKLGEVKFTYDGYTGFDQVENTIETQDAYERARFVATALANRQKSPLALYQPYLIGIPGLTNTDWQDEIFRSGFVQSHNITVSGATEKMNFFVAGGYFDQDGIVLGSTYDRINLRANLNFDISEKFRAGFMIAPSFSNRNRVSDDDHKGNGVILTALIANPLFSPYNSDGSLNLSSDMLLSARENGQATVENPVAMALLNTDKREELTILGNTFLEYEPLKGLTFKTFLGADFLNINRKSLSPDNVGAYSVAVENKQETAFTSFFDRKNWIIENTVTYQNSFNENHNVNVLLGQSFQTERFLSEKLNIIDGDLQAPTNATTFPNLFEEKWSLISYLGRVNYDFKDKYIIGASIRRDGSSRFGANTKWGWFPSVSGAWRVSQEGFFNSNSISELKLRGSWGVTGNNSIPNYGAIPLLGTTNYGDDVGFAPFTSPNENLSWEQTNTLDVGIDVGLFNNKLALTADYYKAITNDLLLNVPVPAHSGSSSSLRNFGKVQNSGFELALNVKNVKLGKVKWSSTFNISTNKNEVLELGPDQDRIQSIYHVTEVGKPLGSYYTYRLTGIFQNQEQIDNAPIHPEQGLGDYMFADLDGDGKITSGDKEISGDFFPDYTFGFSNTFKYKNFALSFLIQGKQGYEIFNGTGFFIRNLEGWSNGHADLNNYYSESNPNATYAHPGKHVKTYEQSDLLVEDGSYVRLRKVSLGYSLPKEFLEHTFLDKAKFFISGKNLFTWTDYTGYNPEVSSRNKSFNSSNLTPGFDYGAYPIARTVVIGVKLSF